MSEPYHRFVFDVKQRRFLGDFEGMYAAETREGFDSWRQDDLDDFHKQVLLRMIQSFDHDSLLDLGCGKGALTARIGRHCSRVVGVDVSPTALDVARKRLPHGEFHALDIEEGDWVQLGEDRRFDLVLCAETLSYLRSWPTVLERVSRIARRCVISLYLPGEPIGFVKTHRDLLTTFERHFALEEAITFTVARQQIVQGVPLVGE